ncbi:hypothetical protein A3A95_01450 [Candidatus Nomurabacteria bacterium RIFCSPLOWO2_01_FULL_39_18]|uniref:Uncharacterized protein n=1 Tax=Candidatus Nomurabacteria bacterium RIFCSPHIGHO2_01_FULL_40_24b TaxID=1801739 RepID=A0A1F6V8E4_9BACT|nr:MAG: hypothetical protein A2647_00240 [Candidatus Nomurabacteria bacterium RIFCSPHIGHO2_01_FULL_40_24b]OGI88955.1 MAG: hypothetical protein A3A95_01450 [Candidatus Nomurabacteria bacterium RIFCSPLOWO2_01_FULL_39_18]
METRQPLPPKGPAVERIKKLEEQEVRALLVELELYLPPEIVIIPVPGQLVQGTQPDIEELVRTFVGHPERMTWLRDFVFGAKKKMIGALPEGTDITGRKIKRDFFRRFQNFK